MSPLRKERHTNGRLIDNEGRAEEVEKKKQEHLNKQKEGKGHWEEQLASDSESAVRLSAHAHFPSPDNMKYAQTREREREFANERYHRSRRIDPRRDRTLSSRSSSCRRKQRRFRPRLLICTTDGRGELWRVPRELEPPLLFVG